MRWNGASRPTDIRKGTSARKTGMSVFKAAGQPLMDEVDVNAIQLGAELIERVKFALLRTPVELVGPIRKHMSKVLEVGAMLPSNARCLIRPARITDARPKVRENLLLDPDREGLDTQGLLRLAHLRSWRRGPRFPFALAARLALRDRRAPSAGLRAADILARLAYFGW